MFREVLLKELPERLELRGDVHFDATSALPRRAPAAGVVVHCRMIGSMVSQGEVVMTIRGSTYRSAQRAFIRVLLAEGKASEALRLARKKLHRLKFATSQIDEIARTLNVLDPLPILTPRAGIITDILKEKSKFRGADQLLCLASDRYIEVALDTALASYLRPGKVIHVADSWPPIPAVLSEKGTPDPSDRCRCKFSVGDIPIQQQLRLSVQFDVCERLGPEITHADWPYLLPPRRLDRIRLGLEKPLPAPLRPDVISSKPQNPFSANTDNRPPRVIAPYDGPKELGSNSAHHRYSVELSIADWHQLRVATTTPESRKFTTIWEIVTTLRAQSTASGGQTVTAAQAGQFKALTSARGQLIPSNTVLGHLYADPASKQPPTPVCAPCAGFVVEISASNFVASGDKLAVVAPTPHILSIPESCPPEHFSQLRVRNPTQPDTLFSLPPIALCGDQAAGFDVPFPSGFGPFEEGQSFSVALEMTNGSRNSLALPSDCLVKQGNSHELLLHHGLGKLTPVAVRVNQPGTFVEILLGINKTAHVVRDLEKLCQLDRRIGALMTGFWVG
jgi:biotin carboxyl carrier protein